MSANHERSVEAAKAKNGGDLPSDLYNLTNAQLETAKCKNVCRLGTNCLLFLRKIPKMCGQNKNFSEIRVTFTV